MWLGFPYAKRRTGPFPKFHLHCLVNLGSSFPFKWKPEKYGSIQVCLVKPLAAFTYRAARASSRPSRPERDRIIPLYFSLRIFLNVKDALPFSSSIFSILSASIFRPSTSSLLHCLQLDNVQLSSHWVGPCLLSTTKIFQEISNDLERQSFPISCLPPFPPTHVILQTRRLSSRLRILGGQ